MARLKLDADYKNAVINGAARSTSSNPFFTGEGVTVDGLIIHEFRYVYNTLGAATKWGGDTTHGCRALFCGAQALGMADIGSPYWVEKEFDYDNQPGISVGKMVGFRKPKFLNNYTGQVEDYGVMTCDFAM
jgi:hypothetical protein